MFGTASKLVGKKGVGLKVTRLYNLWPERLPNNSLQKFTIHEPKLISQQTKEAHSARRAFDGSTEAALAAGTIPAARTVTARHIATASSDAGSNMVIP